MKKTIIKGAIVATVFFMTILIVSRMMNQGNTDMTTEMGKAVYPVISVNYGGFHLNEMHGYKEAMELSQMRESITPLAPGRKITLDIQPYGTMVQGVAFEVRSPDGGRLVESTQLENFKPSGEEATITFALKDLIEANQEYALVILLTLEGGSQVRYYTRVVSTEEYFVDEKLAFVWDFSGKTFDKEEATSLTKYMESSAEGDNTTFGRVDIHSSFQQMTWGELAVTREGPVNFTIRELGPQLGSFVLDYYVSVPEGRGKNYYMVKEFYRVRHTSDRMYLLDFERAMDQIFDPKGNVYANNKIMLGITSRDIPLLESDGGNNLAFITGNRLFCYNFAENKMALLFSFYNKGNLDKRTLYQGHEMKLLHVDEGGNVIFLVYGYMNRGRHEGAVGISVYYYDSSVNTVEEMVYIPCNESQALLKEEVGQLSYINKNSMLYLKWKDTIYGIHIMNHTCNVVVENLAEGRYKVSESNKMAVWQKEGSLYDGQELVLMNMTTGKQKSIKAAAGEILSPIGFMEEDMIYGIAREEDIVTDSAGNTVFPMYCLRIENETEGVLMEYREENVYVTAGKVTGNQIILSRVEKGEEGGYVPIKDDQIMNAEKEVVKRNTIETAVTEKYEKLTQIALKASISADTLIHQTPREVFVEEGREVRISQYEQEDGRRYYVYGKYGIENTYTNEKSAVNHADEISGVVINKEGYYVWQKGNRSLSNQIMAIHGEMMSEDRSSLAVCLDSLLAYEGVVRNSKYLLERGGSVLSILKDSLPDVEVLDLTGCTLDAVLYYVNQDIPVLALLRDGSAVLLVGFNEKNTVIMNPETGTVYKMGMNDSREWFEQNGNCFLTYIRNRD
ncbi:hypothetical protein IMSAGC019_03161 [Lachnospiraceae bacterium]|nr:hypothetical protein IMSAGC019_03161 [Lachnospiraceae bacterium]